MGDDDGLRRGIVHLHRRRYRKPKRDEAEGTVNQHSGAE